MAWRGITFVRKRPAAALLALAGVALGVHFTWGMAATFDSVRYANVGHWIAAGEGIASSITTVPVQDGTRATGDGLHAFTIQPPGLPLFYAATGAAHWRASHRVLHVLCYGVLALVVLQLARTLLGRTVPAVCVALLALANPVIQTTAASYWTDLPFTVLLLGSLAAVIRAQQAERHWWRWLLLASLLAALAVGFRLTGLALGAVFLLDGVRGAVRRGPRHGLLRLAAAGSLVAPVAALLFLRNLRLSGSFRGTAPLDMAPPVEPSLARAWNFLASRLLEAGVPGFAHESVAGHAAQANANLQGWTAAGAAVAVALVGGAVVVALRRRGLVSWPAPATRRGGAAGWSAALLVAAYLAVYALPLAKHPEYHVVEARFVAPILPLLLVPVAAVLCGSGRRSFDLALGGAVTVVFLAGAIAHHEPYRHGNAPLQNGLDWLAANVPPETPVLTNVGKILLDEDITRRVYHITDWYYRSVLPEQMRSDRGLRRWAAARGVEYVLLVGTPNRRQQFYWGEIITQLAEGRRWPDQLRYRDRFMRVYHVPAPGQPVRGGKGRSGS
jgi:hypothetical protein